MHTCKTDPWVGHVWQTRDHRQLKLRGRYIVGIAGAPGSGKTTAARAVCDRVNQQYAAGRQDGSAAEAAVVVPMDGTAPPPPGVKILILEGRWRMVVECLIYDIGVNGIHSNGKEAGL